jgi:hypothetical protein
VEGRPNTHQTALLRVIWTITFVVPLILAALLLGIKSAQAAPGMQTIVPLALDEEFGAEEEMGFEEDACEVAEEELEEGLRDEAEVERLCGEDSGDEKAVGSTSVVPEECLLRSSHARFVAYDSHNAVRLTVGYTTYEPASATVDYGTKGGKGSVHLGTVKRHLGRSGVLRLTKELGDAEMAKVQAAGRLSVRLHVVGTPDSCRRYETEQLNLKHH